MVTVYEELEMSCPAGLLYGPRGPLFQEYMMKGYPQIRPFCWAPIRNTPITVVTSTKAKMKEPIPSPNEKRVVDLINALRKRMGLNELTIDRKLTLAARGHSEYMRKSGISGHHIPGHPLGASPIDRARRVGYHSGVGENIAEYTDGYSPDAAFLAWYHSPAHRGNMLSPDWNSIGVGDSGTQWTANFGQS